jgi:hypothetical protein
MNVWRTRSRRAPRAGTKLARVPITPEAGSYTRYGRPAVWRLWFPAIITLGVLVGAPMVAHGQGADSVVVSWAAPGDDGNVGTASTYDLRVSTSTITAANFASALSVPNVPAPGAAGTSQSVTVLGLTRGTIYYFAIRTADDQGNWSTISNVARWDWNLDTAPPAAPSGLHATRDGAGVHVAWSANSEPDLAGYYVYRRINGAGAVRLNGALLTSPQYVDAMAPDDGSTITYDVTAVDVNDNESAHSSSVSPTTTASGVDWAMLPAYPNPSALAQSTTLPLVIGSGVSGDVTVEIRDTGGRLVRRLVIPNPLPGPTQVVWDGNNDAGRPTVPGVYRGSLVQGDAHASVRFVRRP